MRVLITADVDTDYYGITNGAEQYLETQINTTRAVDVSRAATYDEVVREYAIRQYESLGGKWRRTDDETRKAWLRAARFDIDELVEIVTFLSTTRINPNEEN